MSVFLYHGFVKSVPVALEEAATIDGCSKFGVFWRIGIPDVKAGNNDRNYSCGYLDLE